MHKQARRVGLVFHFFLSFFFGLPDPLWGPSWAHWGPSGALWGLPTKTFFLSFLLGIDPKEAEALSSHHIWTFIPSVCSSVCTYIRFYPPPRCCSSTEMGHREPMTINAFVYFSHLIWLFLSPYSTNRNLFYCCLHPTQWAFKRPKHPKINESSLKKGNVRLYLVITPKLCSVWGPNT
jgi:hypothetical protein